MTRTHYKGFTITSRSYQVRGSGRWTLDLLIGHRDLLRAFSSRETYGSEAAAWTGCLAFGQRVIDDGGPGCRLADLRDRQAPPRT